MADANQQKQRGPVPSVVKHEAPSVAAGSHSGISSPEARPCRP